MDRPGRDRGRSSGRSEQAILLGRDGTAVGAVAAKETVEVAVAPGHHTLRLGQGRHLSPQRSFEVAQDEVVIYCHGPRYGWPQLLAALVKNDLWITLHRE